MSSHQSCAPDCPGGPRINVHGSSLDCGHSERAPTPTPPQVEYKTQRIYPWLSPLLGSFGCLLRTLEMVLEYCSRLLSPPCSGVSLLSSQLLQEKQKGSYDVPADSGVGKGSQEKSPLFLLPYPIPETFGKLETMDPFPSLGVRTLSLHRYSPLSGTQY